MNKHVLFVAVTILILAGTGIVSQAYAAFTITMETDKDVYDHSSVITVTGQAEPVDPEGSEVSIQVFAPNGNWVDVAQVSVDNGCNFSAKFNTASWGSDGTYMIKAQYGKLTDVTVSIELPNAIEASKTVTGTTVTTVTGPSGESFYKLGAGQIE